MEEEQIIEIAESEFGEKPDSLEEIVGGVMNQTFRLNYGDKSYILQVNEKTEAHEMKNCLNCFQFFKDGKVPVPDTITDTVKEHESSHYIIVEDLKSDSLNEDINPENSRTAGRYLAYIHDSKSFEEAGWWTWEESETQVVGFPNNSLKSRIEDNLESNLEYFKEENIEWLIEISERFLNEYLDLVPTDFKPVFVHHDYNPGNILAKDGEIKGILDFDYAHSSHGQRDLVKAANNFWIRGEVNRKHIYEAYREVRELDETFWKNEPLYRLETLIDILKSFIEHDQITVEKAKDYKSDLKDVEKEINSTQKDAI